jgi:hypothetical protein
MYRESCKLGQEDDLSASDGHTDGSGDSDSSFHNAEREFPSDLSGSFAWHGSSIDNSDWGLGYASGAVDAAVTVTVTDHSLFWRSEAPWPESPRLTREHSSSDPPELDLQDTTEHWESVPLAQDIPLNASAGEMIIESAPIAGSADEKDEEQQQLLQKKIKEEKMAKSNRDSIACTLAASLLRSAERESEKSDAGSAHMAVPAASEVITSLATREKQPHFLGCPSQALSRSYSSYSSSIEERVVTCPPASWEGANNVVETLVEMARAGEKCIPGSASDSSAPLSGTELNRSEETARQEEKGKQLSQRFMEVWREYSVPLCPSEVERENSLSLRQLWEWQDIAAQVTIKAEEDEREEVEARNLGKHTQAGALAPSPSLALIVGLAGGYSFSSGIAPADQRSPNQLGEVVTQASLVAGPRPRATVPALHSIGLKFPAGLAAAKASQGATQLSSEGAALARSPHLLQGLLHVLDKAHWSAPEKWAEYNLANAARVSAVGSDLIIGFRGTASLRDIWTDLRFQSAPGPFGAHVHKGFLDALECVEGENGCQEQGAGVLVAEIAALAKQSGCSRVILTGYSMGGAVASLFTLKHAQTLLDNGLDVRCITFGCPQFIAQADVGKIPEALKARILHTYAEGDPVPLSLTSLCPWPLKPWGFQYTHVGNSALLSESGNGLRLWDQQASAREGHGAGIAKLCQWGLEKIAEPWSHLTTSYDRMLRLTHLQCNIEVVLKKFPHVLQAPFAALSRRKDQ